MDTIQSLAKLHDLFDPMFTKELVLNVFESTSKESGGLALFLVHLMCYAFLSRMDGKGSDGKNQKNKTFGDEDLDLMWEIGKESKTVFKLLQDRIINEIRSPSNKTTVDPRNRDESRTPIRCLYHSHREGHYCREERESTNSCFILDISKKGCTTFKNSLSNLNHASGETSYPVAQVASRIDKWKTKQGSSSWKLILSLYDCSLWLYNNSNDYVAEISVADIDRIVACELGSSPQITIHRSRHNDPSKPALGMEFRDTEQCNKFKEDLRAACKTTFKMLST